MRVQLFPASVVLKMLSPTPAYTVEDCTGSTTRACTGPPQTPGKIPVSARSQVAPPSVLRKAPDVPPAQSVDGECGSSARVSTSPCVKPVAFHVAPSSSL